MRFRFSRPDLHRTIPVATGFALLVAGAALGGCSRHDAEPLDLNNDTGVVESDNVALPQDLPPPSPSPVETALPPGVTGNAVALPPPPPPAEPDAQVLDDASTTGMTARADRGQPAQDEAPSADVRQ